MEDDTYMEGYSDGQSDTRSEYDPSRWRKNGHPFWCPLTDDRVMVEIHPDALDRLRDTLNTDSRFQGLGYSQFIMMALDLLTQ